MTTTTHPDTPLPAGVEYYEEEWHHSPNDAAQYRWFATKKFPVFDWLTVHTGGHPVCAGRRPGVHRA